MQMCSRKVYKNMIQSFLKTMVSCTINLITKVSIETNLGNVELVFFFYLLGMELYYDYNKIILLIQNLMRIC